VEGQGVLGAVQKHYIDWLWHVRAKQIFVDFLNKQRRERGSVQELVNSKETK